MFDTGSSLFAPLTTSQRAAAATTGAVKDSIKTSSWGTNYYVYGRSLKGAVYFGDKRLTEPLIFSDNLHIFDKFLERENIWGITGNAFFLNSTFIIDYENHVFGAQ